MPTYKLTYFNARARAELTRLLFALADVQYEDNRITSDDWAKLKANVRTGALPILEVDGKQLNQSMAIARYVAAEFKLAGSNQWESAQCDAVLETVAEIKTALTPIFSEKDDAKKAEMKKTVFEEKTKPKLAILEKWVRDNGEVFVGKTLTVADLDTFHLMQLLAGYIGADLSGYPKLQALKAKVEGNPKVATWLAKRPVTPF